MEVLCLFHVLLGSALFISSFAIILTGKRADWCTLFVFLVSCDCYCSVAIPCVAVGWSEVCDCGIFILIYLFSMQPFRNPVNVFLDTWG